MLQKPKFFAAALLLFVSGISLAGDGDVVQHNPFIGRWVVTKVLCDSKDPEENRTILCDDPSGKWRIFSFSENSLTGNP